MRLIMLSTCAVVTIAACSPQVPDSLAGVGFDSAPIGIRARAAAEPAADSLLPPAPPPISQGTLDASAVPNAITLQNALQAITPGATPQPVSGVSPSVTSVPDPDAEIAAAAVAALSSAAATNSGIEPLQANPSNSQPKLLNNPAISDENDFGAVTARQSIEGDARRIESQRQQRVEVAPMTVPERPAGTQPNIVAYALLTSHPRGQKVYTRVGINLAQRAERNCAHYPFVDQAQIAFLAAGGPERDRLNLDPDGDGYACTWDPAPFRAAVYR